VIEIEAMKWYSLSEAERAKLNALGVKCKKSIITPPSLPINCAVSPTGYNAFKITEQYTLDGVYTKSNDDQVTSANKNQCQWHIVCLQAVTDDAATRISNRFQSFIDGCSVSSGRTNVALMLAANIMHKCTVIGLLFWHVGPHERFNSYEMRVDWDKMANYKHVLDANMSLKVLGDLFMICDVADNLLD